MSPKKMREVLLVDDNPADLDLFRDALSGSEPPPNVNTVPDGEEAIAFLYRSGKFQSVARPDLVILDLNLPRKNGRAVLASVKADPALRLIPIVVFTTSVSEQDIQDSYSLGANCYVGKPGSLGEYRAAVRAIEYFWLSVARVCR